MAPFQLCKIKKRLFELLKDHCEIVSERHCMKYISILEAIKNRSTYLYIFLLIFLMNSLAMKWCVWRLSIILEFFNSLHVLLVLVTLVWSTATLWWNWVKVPRLQINYTRFPEACLLTSEFCEPCFSECYVWSFQGVSCLLRTILFSIFFDNFYKAFFLRELVHKMMAQTLSAKFRFCVANK